MNFIPLMSPNIPEKAIENVGNVLRSGMLIQGENVREFEGEVAEYLNVEHVVAVSNGTASLHLALLAHGIGPGDEVITPAFSYIATANVVEVVGAKPVFVDTDPGTFNIDVQQIEDRLTPRTKAILPVHEFGLACDIRNLCDIAERNELIVIEDAACALGAKVGSRSVGTFGQAGSFSLHPRKAVTSGEGGLLVTSDAELAIRFRALRNHGIDPVQESMDFIVPGLNYRMTDFQAALVRPQFESIERGIAHKERLAGVYFSLLQDVSEIQMPLTSPNKRHSWQTFHIVLADHLDRDEVIREMRLEGVGTNLGAQCIPHQSYFSSKYRIDCRREFPNAMRAFEQGLALPLYEKLTEQDVQFVSEKLREVISRDV